MLISGIKCHNSDGCKNDVKSVNLSGDHSAHSFNCSKFKTEKAVLSLTTKDRNFFNYEKRAV